MRWRTLLLQRKGANSTGRSMSRRTAFSCQFVGDEASDAVFGPAAGDKRKSSSCSDIPVALLFNS